MAATTIYLSPHYDDICFSLGMTAKADGGHLVNIFTDCNYIRAKDIATDDAAGLRDAEDKAFAEGCGLLRHNLGLAEAPVQGFKPFDLTGVEQEGEAVGKALAALLPGLLKKSPRSRANIYCPLAIGRHRNHLSVFLAVMASYAELKKQAKIFFYEDLPYAATLEHRKEAILRLAYFFPPEKIVRHANELSEDEMGEKMRLISLYRSQHRGAPERKDFIPVDPLTPVPHEAFWEAA